MTQLLSLKFALLLATCGLAAPLCAFAQSAPLVGLWKTIDDQTQKEKSMVRLTDDDGVVSGTIEKLFDPTQQEAKCGHCPEPFKNRPVLGMTVLRNLSHSTEDPALWSGGEILDPQNGKYYKVRLRLFDGGKQLEVRGYIGLPVLGRTQTWSRVE